MTGMLMEIRRDKRENQRKFALDKGLRDALADYLRRRYPTNTAKLTARAFNLTIDQGRSAAGGKPSLSTIELIFKRGGWGVVLSVMADVIGHSITNYFIELRGVHEQQAERLGALTSDIWPVPRPRGDDPAGLDDPQAERRIARRS